MTRVGRRKRASPKFVVRLTDQTLSCAARAHVLTAARHGACLHLKRAMLAACRRSNTAERGGSAAEPKPGRASFYGELAGRLRQKVWSFLERAAKLPVWKLTYKNGVSAQ